MPETDGECKTLRIKLISMGAAECGKSCVIKRYCEKRFVSKYMATLGIDFGVTRVRISNCDVKVNIFDMAGQPFFYEVRNEFYKDTQGALLVYDVTDRASFDALGQWLVEMKENLPNPSDIDSIVCAVCANKVDMGRRKVDESEGRLWAETRGFLYFETSAQTGENITEVFQALLSSVVSMVTRGERTGPTPLNLGYTSEQASLVQRVCACKDSYDILGVSRGSGRDEINRAYKHLAVLLHPDKNLAPGSEEAFKVIASAKEELLRRR